MAESKMVKQWFKYAADDLKVAKAILDFGTRFKATSAFHSQQCVEKAIKGYLASKRVRFTKTHKIEELAELVATLDVDFSKVLKKCQYMTEFAIAYRYPDAVKKRPPTVARAKAAIKKADQVFTACLKKAHKE